MPKLSSLAKIIITNIPVNRIVQKVETKAAKHSGG
jgi:hypothetical protein